jgi:hypothetical protein
MSAYVEVDHGESLPAFCDPVKVYSLTEGSFTFDKDYEVFDALAGGRDATMAPEDRDPSRVPLFATRGMPSPCSLTVGRDYYRLVADPPDLPDRHFWPQWGCVSSAVAAEWVRDKGCGEAEFLQWFNCVPENLLWPVVSVPGVYNATWLRPDEFDAALRHHGLKLARLPAVYRIIRSALALLSEQHGSERVRLVLWFS